ncbi:MAG: SDR family oxidoreductase [Clostridiales bacterium]|jgi:dihydroflavonol-4-reductase|nr:SDR family oxidoreductase [Clostridiales bacterium]
MNRRLNVVTGATGHIGSALVRILLEQGETVRAVVLPGEDLTPLNGLDVELFNGDVTDLSSMVQAFQGADRVYHLAGVISIWSGRKKQLQRVNVQGTANVIKACKENHVQRLVYTSSVHAIADPAKNQCMTETDVFNPSIVKGAYAKSKAAATSLVLRAAKEGLDAVVVHPSGVIGPYEYKLSNIGQLIINFSRHKLPAYIDGGYNFVDVRDVAQGAIAAAEHGKSGECYILSGESMSVKELLECLKDHTGVDLPKTKIPRLLAKMIAPFAEFGYMIKKQQPLFTCYSVSTLGTNPSISHQKATAELGYHPRPIRQSLCDAVSWLKNSGRLGSNSKPSKRRSL